MEKSAVTFTTGRIVPDSWTALLGIAGLAALLHLPGVIVAPASRLQWTMPGVASRIAGAARMIAGSAAAETDAT